LALIASLLAMVSNWLERGIVTVSGPDLALVSLAVAMFVPASSTTVWKWTDVFVGIDDTLMLVAP
jgi:hypothetical protein